ncbi:hypothetical protein LIER_24335 [Lithospermum erythrorhizon]|uniref:Uncharacterized protein n=1 Tax=Lithospermum erythrorhizon TaxID=34254 RepID=A0AAV3R3X8_LITER
MAGSEGIMTDVVEKFDGIDFSYWHMNMEDYLYGKEPRLSRNVPANFAKETTIKRPMKALYDLYEKTSANNKVKKSREFSSQLEQANAIMTMRSEKLLDTGAHGNEKIEKVDKDDRLEGGWPEKDNVEEVVKPYVLPVPFQRGS